MSGSPLKKALTILVSMVNLIDSLTGFIDYALECIRFLESAKKSGVGIS
jgi:hypothetical protein